MLGSIAIDIRKKLIYKYLLVMFNIIFANKCWHAFAFHLLAKAKSIYCLSSPHVQQKKTFWVNMVSSGKSADMLPSAVIHGRLNNVSILVIVKAAKRGFLEMRLHAQPVVTQVASFKSVSTELTGKYNQ